ncbi:MAG: Iron complex transport system substrate-binding protein [Hydrocarboniphaga sp.]|uniref:cobalamin-binding protein n=1 Tax=Hydrocarboniphaga sp. TaxID=2033016 RepID=UPI00263474A8|nr:cobalamin-binding protein [Hydrocarboniphaga sp.]MDB5972062.1 Iron complex transport system substrate-binding protein [Hydrocarboniphaga sp.]
MIKRIAALMLVLAAPAIAEAARVVALAPHLAELVCAAGACDQLVGRIEYSDYPASVRALPSVGDAFNLNAEALLALNPDLVITWQNGTPAATIAQIERLGIRTLPIEIHKLVDIESALLTIGTQLGSATTAQAEAMRFHQRIDALGKQYRSASKLRVFYQIEADPIFTINRDSPISEAISLCGGENIFADLPLLAGALGREAVLARDPDVVVWGRQDAASDKIRAFWQRWPDAHATRRGNLYAVDADTLARATPRMADGITELCGVLDEARRKGKP